MGVIEHLIFRSETQTTFYLSLFSLKVTVTVGILNNNAGYPNGWWPGSCPGVVSGSNPSPASKRYFNNVLSLVKVLITFLRFFTKAEHYVFCLLFF